MFLKILTKVPFVLAMAMLLQVYVLKSVNAKENDVIEKCLKESEKEICSIRFSGSTQKIIVHRNIENGQTEVYNICAETISSCESSIEITKKESRAKVFMPPFFILMSKTDTIIDRVVPEREFSENQCHFAAKIRACINTIKSENSGCSLK